MLAKKTLITTCLLASLTITPILSYSKSIIPTIPPIMTEIQYKVIYARDYKATLPSLKNATLRLQLYAYGQPVGLITQKTNEQQSFTLKTHYGKDLIVDVVAIKGMGKHIRCVGTSAIKATEIKISCRL